MFSLTAAVLEEQHTAEEYLRWARGLVQKIKAEPDGLRRIRLRIGYVKHLIEEAIPIGILASRYFEDSDQVRIALKLGSQTYDATVVDSRIECSSVAHIEVTLAHAGEAEYLRMVCLNETGQVSGLGAVTKNGTQRTGLKVSVASEMVSQEEVLSHERALVSDAIARKIIRPYPPNTLLLIAFDDTMAFGRLDNIANLEDVLTGYASKLRGFHSIAIVGLHNGLYILRPTGDAI